MSHVTSASDILAIALAKMGASLVGSRACAMRTCAIVGLRTTCGGISKERTPRIVEHWEFASDVAFRLINDLLGNNRDDIVGKAGGKNDARGPGWRIKSREECARVKKDS